MVVINLQCLFIDISHDDDNMKQIDKIKKNVPYNGTTDPILS